MSRRDRLLVMTCALGLIGASFVWVALQIVKADSAECVRFIEENNLLASCGSPPDDIAFFAAGATVLVLGVVSLGIVARARPLRIHPARRP